MTENDKSQFSRRRAARLGIVQALYRIELGGEKPAAVIRDFIDHRLGQEIEGEHYLEADTVWFTDVVLGVHSRAAEIDGLLTQAFDKPDRLARVEALMRATLRGAAFELLCRPDVPAAVIIDEYVEVARAFFGGSEPGLINAALDKVARITRPGELEERHAPRNRR
jgi:N utilization substance protein B